MSSIPGGADSEPGGADPAPRVTPHEKGAQSEESVEKRSPRMEANKPAKLVKPEGAQASMISPEGKEKCETPFILSQVLDLCAFVFSYIRKTWCFDVLTRYGTVFVHTR